MSTRRGPMDLRKRSYASVISGIVHPCHLLAVEVSIVNIQPLRRRIAHSAMELFFGANKRAVELPGLLPGQGIQRILICRISHSLGNTLLITPLIREIEACFPGAQIDVLTRSAVSDAIFGTFFSVGNNFRLPAHGFRHPLRWLEVLRGIRRTHYDLVIDPCLRSQTGRLMLLLAKSRFKLGFSDERAGTTLTHVVDAPTIPMPVGQLPVFLLRSALGVVAPRAYPVPDLALTGTEHQQGRAALGRLTARFAGNNEKPGVIGIFANATGHKLLGNEWWRKFMAALEPHCGAYSLVEIVPMSGKSLLDERYPAYYSSDIRKLASVLSGLSRFISADCGIMHLACASGAPVTGIFTVTDAAEWGPYGPNDRVVLAQDLSPAQVAERIAAQLVA